MIGISGHRIASVSDHYYLHLQSDFPAIVRSLASSPPLTATAHSATLADNKKILKDHNNGLAITLPPPTLPASAPGRPCRVDLAAHGAAPNAL